jgi:hypothetical protein
MADVALILELWIYGSYIRGLVSSGGTIFSVASDGNERSCIYVRNNINVLSLLEPCSGRYINGEDDIQYVSGGSHKEFTVTSAYLRHDLDEPPPSKEQRDITAAGVTGESNSSLDVMQMHNTLYEGALVPVQEEKPLWNI